MTSVDPSPGAVAPASTAIAPPGGLAHVNAIAGRLSLRPPQRDSLLILSRLCDLLTLDKNADLPAELAKVSSEFPSVADFERDFPSLCFALATGVGKTRLMGAFVTYLFRAEQVRNFFVLAPGLTIYEKLIRDFTPNTPKYVFKGIAEFAVDPPLVITGDNYEQQAATLFRRDEGCTINIFNISKINSEVRGGKAPRIRRMAEYLGQPYFDYLASLDDLVLLMDESHRYRASAGVRAINELRPILGLELTATPFVESAKGPIPFRNAIYSYPLAMAMEDGFVKEPAVVTRKDFNPAGMSPEELEQLKLEDGVRLHEQVKVELATFAAQTGQAVVKPFILVIARDTIHAKALLDLIESDAFFEGRYRGKAIQVDSSQTGEKEEQMVARLLAVESADEPTEIVIHVNMLKEGWDVTNLYTIVPLRAANARTLIEQSIGRGLRLPYGRLTGVEAVDTLSIVAHDKFQEIVDEARRPGSVIRMKTIELTDAQLNQRSASVAIASNAAIALGLAPPPGAAPGFVTPKQAQPVFKTDTERAIAKATSDAIRALERNPSEVPHTGMLLDPAVQSKLVEAVKAELTSGQLPELGPVVPAGVDIAKIVETTSRTIVEGTIDIPRIVVQPMGRVECGFKPFTLDLSALSLQPPSDEIWVQMLRTGDQKIVPLGPAHDIESRPEDYVISGLVDFDDICYDDLADLLYELAGKVVAHLRGYLDDEKTNRVLRANQRRIAANLHAQMQDHAYEKAAGYQTVVTHGFVELRIEHVASDATKTVVDFRQPAASGSISRTLFGGFERCLQPVQRFQSDTERRFAVILDRDAVRWFRPAKGQFQITYRVGSAEPYYVPDFVAETATELLMIETKAVKDLTTPEVLAKAEAARKWCELASGHARSHGRKEWRYLLVPHTEVDENRTLEALVKAFGGVGRASGHAASCARIHRLFPTLGAPR